MTSTLKVIFIAAFACLFLSCGQQTDKTEDKSSVLTSDTSQTNQPGETLSPHQQELNKALADENVDDYYKEICKQGKLIKTDENKMLSITDSLFTDDPDKDLFYFIVFTKSMNGSDGAYAEALGLASYNFLTAKTEWFADYFNVAPELTDKDIDNWASYIFGEIQISKEGEEVKAIKELEAQLLENLRRRRKEYSVIIERLFEKIKSIARNEGYKI